MDFEDEPAMHVRVDDKAGSIERVGKHLVEEEVPGPRLGLVGHEHEDWIGTAFLKLHLRDARPHPFHVAGERVGEHVLAGTIEFHLPGHFGAFHEDLPGKGMDLLVVLPPGMGHDQLGIVPAVRDKGVDQELPLLLLQHLCCLLEDQGMGP